MPFALAELPEAAEPPAPPRRRKLDLARRWAPYAAGGMVLLLLAVVALRRRTPSATDVDARLVGTEGGAPALPDAPAVPQLEPALIARDAGDLRARAHSRAGEDPATAALVLRSWLGTTAPDGSPATTRG